jgi:galactokinase
VDIEALHGRQHSRLTDAFGELAGREPEGVWWAPGRVNLIGEHTDYNDGFVLPLAIGRGTFAALARRDDGALRCLSLEEGSGDTDGWGAYVHGVAWALREAGLDVGGADVVVATELARGAGLSSSAALECAVALGLAELSAADVDRLVVAKACRRAENEVVGVPTGLMDQLASLLAREGHALFVDTRSLEVRHVPLDLGGATRLLVVDTRTTRELRAGAYTDRRTACETAARALGVGALRDVAPAELDAAADRLAAAVLRRARHVVTENDRVLRAVEALESQRYAEVGELLCASHRSLRDDFEVSSPALDLSVDAAMEAGAYGARMTGAGFGGCALALVPDERADAVAAAVRARFAQSAFADPEIFEATAVDGARRIA